MRPIGSIFKFVVFDMLRSAWLIAYMLFFVISGFSLVYFTGSFYRSMVSIMNIVILIAPLVSTMMTSMYYFNKSDFVYLMMAQPIKRSSIFLGMYLGIATALSLAAALGLLIAFATVGTDPTEVPLLITLIVAAVLLSLIFSGIAFFLAVVSRDKLRGVGMALLVWLIMAVVYDGLLLMYFLAFADYPIEEHAIALSMFNPIDLARIFVMLKLDVSALMGYSGAIFARFFGAPSGMMLTFTAMLLWIVIPLWLTVLIGRKKDF